MVKCLLLKKKKISYDKLFCFGCYVQLLKPTQELTLKLYGFTCFAVGVSETPRGKTRTKGGKKRNFPFVLLCPFTLPHAFICRVQ